MGDSQGTLTLTLTLALTLTLPLTLTLYLPARSATSSGCPAASPELRDLPASPELPVLLLTQSPACGRPSRTNLTVTVTLTLTLALALTLTLTLSLL